MPPQDGIYSVDLPIGVLDLVEHDEQIQVGVGIFVAPGARAEQQDATQSTPVERTQVGCDGPREGLGVDRDERMLRREEPLPAMREARDTQRLAVRELFRVVRRLLGA